MTWLFFLGSVLAASTPTEKQFDILGYAPDLNVIFAQSYVIPDNKKCLGYILDLDKHMKFAMGPLNGLSEALVAAGEDAEGSSCQLREFAGPLELTLRTEKTYSSAEKTLVAPLVKADWKGIIPGYKNASINSLGTFLRLHRPKWHPEMLAKVYDLGATEAEDKNWVDALNALLITADWKPNYATKEGRLRARKIDDDNEKLMIDKGTMNDKAPRAKVLLAEEVATRLDPKNARPWLNLAKFPEVGFARRAHLVSRALTLDPVMTTKSYRESAALLDLRCDPKAETARKVLPAELTKEPSCT